ncbi:MAG: trypsin-like peptidase domain-containing protein [Akkermansia sp.]
MKFFSLTTLALPALLTPLPLCAQDAVPEAPTAEQAPAAALNAVAPAPEASAESPAPAAEGALPSEEPAPPAEEPAPPAELPAPPAEEPAPPAEEPAPPEELPAEKEPLPAAPDAAAQAAYRSIVKVEVAQQQPNFNIPWNTGEYAQGNGTGFMVAPGLFLTNAHVVSNAERILIAPYGDARKIPARVKFIAHDADLALLEVEDATPFADIPCLKLGSELPQLEDTVRAVGYPVGGSRLSVTRGIVSRIDTIAYAHPQNQSHLAVQIDAAINPGNSGGPVLKGDEVVGVAFQGLQRASATGYMIPIPVIRHFLRDIEDGHYDGYTELGAVFEEASNPALRRHAGLPDDGMGCRVADVIKGSSSDGALQVGDIVLAVGGHPVDSSCMIELDGVRVALQELAERSFSGDVLRFELLRAGQRLSVDVKLAPLKSQRLTARIYDEQPRYIVFGGLVFQPLSMDVAREHGIAESRVAPEADDYIRSGQAAEQNDIVMLTNILRDEVNARFQFLGRGVVTKVNGVPVTGLAQLAELLYPAEGSERPPYTVIELADAPLPLVFDNAVIDAANARIRAHYNLPASARLNP